MRIVTVVAATLAVVFSPATAFSAEESLLAWWRFDEGSGSETLESVSGTEDSVHNAMWVTGASNAALRFDGETTWVVRAAGDAPRLPEGFTIEAWVAVDEYPQGWCPFVNQHQSPGAGFFFGLNEAGFFGLHVSVGGQWHVCNSDIAVPKGKWVHLAGVYGTNRGIWIYIDGQLTGQLGVQGQVPTAEETDLLIGKHNVAPTVFNGIIDELKIHGRALSAEELVIACAASRPAGEPDFGLPPER